MVFFKFDSEVDIWMSGVEILQKPSSGSYIVEQRRSVIHISIQMEGRESTSATLSLQSYT